jgi:hypothetical protein
MNANRVKVELQTGPTTRGFIMTSGKVFIDGVEIKALKSIKIEASYDTITQVTLTLYADVDAEIVNAKVATDGSR